MNNKQKALSLPEAPKGKKGWPWTDVAQTELTDKSALPKMTIVTPSLNQGLYLENTIRSVLLQGYPDLEYIVLDGGSSDNSVDIIKKYGDHISYWHSKPDGGQAQAINRGFFLGKGRILAWLNSDDFYEPGALICAAEHLQKTKN
ncbi:MAG: glycosyltransferase, partial [Candidatus Margulisiibacteriota bacterium]